MKKTIFFCFICLIINTLNAQDSNYTRRIIHELSSDRMYGRGYAYGGDSIAAEFIVQELKKIGAEPIGKQYLQPYNFNSFAMEGQVTLKLDGKLKSPLTDYIISPTALEAHGKFDVINASPKILFSKEALQKFKEKNQAVLAHAFVYIDVTDVKCSDDERQMLNTMLKRINFNNPIGSRGLLVRTTELPAWTWIASDYERNYTLIHLEGEAVKKCPKSIDLDFNNRPHDHRTQNICAMVKGTVSPDTFIVFTAHYDHLGCMGTEVIFHGAHDNASGVAAVLDILRHYEAHPPKYSVAGLFFSGEEAGLKGSSYYVEHPLFPLNKIALLTNIDLMCGGDDGITVVNATSANTRPLFDTMTKINREEQLIKEVKPRDNAANSDHFYFSKHAPAIFIYTMGGRFGRYHHWSDTCKNCGLEKYKSIISLIIKAVDENYMKQD